MHVSDRISGAAVTFLGLLTIVGAIQFPPMPGQDVGPSAFPIVIGIGLGISGLLIALDIGHRFEEEAQADLAAIESETMLAGAEGHARSAWRAWIPPALLLVYVTVVGQVGFVPTAALLILVASLALGARLRLALPMALLAPFVVHLLFAKLLRVPLPVGLLPMPW
jgi:putative tricarboxylic transport membrane protein